jgi:hypothetical protein
MLPVLYSIPKYSLCTEEFSEHSDEIAIYSRTYCLCSSVTEDLGSIELNLRVYVSGAGKRIGKINNPN